MINLDEFRSELLIEARRKVVLEQHKLVKKYFDTVQSDQTVAEMHMAALEFNTEFMKPIDEILAFQNHVDDFIDQVDVLLSSPSVELFARNETALRDNLLGIASNLHRVCEGGDELCSPFRLVVSEQILNPIINQQIEVTDGFENLTLHSSVSTLKSRTPLYLICCIRYWKIEPQETIQKLKDSVTHHANTAETLATFAENNCKCRGDGFLAVASDHGGKAVVVSEKQAPLDDFLRTFRVHTVDKDSDLSNLSFFTYGKIIDGKGVVK